MDSNDLNNFEFLKNLICDGDVLVDVGANYGDYTNFFKDRLNGTGKIYSIELHPETYKKLYETYNNFKNIIILNYAVSNTDEMIPYYKGNDAWTNNIIGHDMNFKDNEKIGLIQSIRLDNLLKDENKIKILKIDVEGAENLVLDGITNIVDKIENILLECHLDKDWGFIKNLLINTYNFKCINLTNKEEINNNSKRAYQCFCKK